MNALIFEGSADTLDHAALFGAVGRDELLAQAIAFDQGRIATAGEDQSVIRLQKERRLDTSEMAVSSNQSLLQCQFSRLGSAAAA